MDPWTVLEIPACQDVKRVKQAYARQLKLNKPDENPAGFQRLHKAYKTALQLAKNTVVEKSSQPGEQAPVTAVNTRLNDVDNTREYDEKKSRETANYTAKVKDTAKAKDTANGTLSARKNVQIAKPREKEAGQQAVMQQLLEQVEQQLTEPTLIPEVKNWYFLQQHQYLLDEAFNRQLGNFIFIKLAEFSLRLKEKNIKNISFDRFKHPDTPVEHQAANTKSERQAMITLVQYLDTLFNWENKRDYFFRFVEEKLCQEIYALLIAQAQSPDNMIRGGQLLVNAQQVIQEDKQQDKEQKFELAKPVYRLLIRTLEFMMLCAVLVKSKEFFERYLGHIITDNVTEFYLVIFAGILYVPILWLTEASKLQASPVMESFGYKVTDLNGQRLTRGQALKRTGFFLLVLLVLAICLLVSGGWAMLFIIVSLFFGKQFWHDHLSETQVIKLVANKPKKRGIFSRLFSKKRG